MRFIAVPFAGLLLAASPAVSQDSVSHSLTISTFPGLNMTPDSAKEVLVGVRQIIENRDGSDDVECKVVEFVLEDPPQPFVQGLPLVIDSAQSFNALGSHGRSVYVVEDIKWCGQSSATRILGCAARGGPVAVIRHPLTPIIWAHELGHAQGLRHFPSSPSNLMFPSAGASMKRLTPQQCAAFKQRQLFPLEVEVAQASERITIAQALEPGQVSDSEAADLSLEELLATAWIHHVPISVVENLSDADIEKVREYLRSDSDYELWPNAVLVLGLRGEQGDLALFRRVLETPVDNNEWIRFAKSNVGLALGYFSNLQKSEEAASLLTSLLYPDNAEAYFKESSSPEADARDLARQAASGAALITDSNLSNALQAQESSSIRGDIDLNVSPQFYQGLEDVRGQVAEEGLLQHLRGIEAGSTPMQ